MSAQVGGYRLRQPFHEEEGVGESGRGGGCPACGGPLVTDLQRGEVVCMQCGLVVAESTVDVGLEWRVFDEREEAG